MYCRCTKVYVNVTQLVSLSCLVTGLLRWLLLHMPSMMPSSSPCFPVGTSSKWSPFLDPASLFLSRCMLPSLWPRTVVWSGLLKVHTRWTIVFQPHHLKYDGRPWAAAVDGVEVTVSGSTTEETGGGVGGTVCSSNCFYQSHTSPNPTLLQLNSLSLLELATLDLSQTCHYQTCYSNSRLIFHTCFVHMHTCGRSSLASYVQGHSSIARDT